MSKKSLSHSVQASAVPMGLNRGRLGRLSTALSIAIAISFMNVDSLITIADKSAAAQEESAEPQTALEKARAKRTGKNSAKSGGEISDFAVGTDPSAKKADWEDSAARAAGAIKSITIEDVKYRFHWIPAGEFVMGSDEDEKDRTDLETLHEVTLSRGCWMLETEVTQEMWESIEGENPSFYSKKGELAKFVGDQDTSDFPVENVSWDDCQKFLTKLAQAAQENMPDQLKFRFRLPTEAEWEYACRAGEYDTYSGANKLDKVGWYEENSGKKAYQEAMNELMENAENDSAYYRGAPADNDASGYCQSETAPRFSQLYGAGYGADDWQLSPEFRNALSRSMPVIPSDNNMYSGPSNIELMTAGTEGLFLRGMIQNGLIRLAACSRQTTQYYNVVAVIKSSVNKYLQYLAKQEQSLRTTGAPVPGIYPPDQPLITFHYIQSERESTLKIWQQVSDEYQRIIGEAPEPAVEDVTDDSAENKDDGADELELTEEDVLLLLKMTLGALGPREVGTKKSNAWGLNDMSGNVAEWTQDYYGVYPDEPTTDPKGPDAESFDLAKSSSRRAVRGGSWQDEESCCRCAARDALEQEESSPFLGFRFVVELGQ